ncbi:family 78 glycoside hydrolase catalytic domain [Agromyces sp. Soil535]|uniref:family 78 glycoside hydrolase catalytic domain n=1 Tax=Agromyces sp. Soil535 TaxID=1736390 RepID=UPI0006F25DA9|nr:family 78 glycoside hydrolase catalytic domain [Agromyces sp. Soil535]KRE31317.1 alpha-L-rhamnosidase [Agromyces sp. Soil535]
MTDAAAQRAHTRIASLRAELRDDAVFLATPTPRLSWTVETDEQGWRQASAEIRAGAELVRLDTDESALVAWPFAPLAPGESREVNVRAVAASGTRSEWSDALTVAAGFLAEGEWVAEPIGLADAERPAQPALVRTTFAVDAPVRRATLFYTALGVAEPELNGTAVDDDVLAPGWTSYRDRLVHETVDVTALLREGENVLGATIAGAWYTEQYGFFRFAERVYGDQPSLLAQLQVEYADGRAQVVATGDGWRALGDGPVVDSGIYAGEHADLRRAQAVAGWSTAEFDASAWPEARRGASARPGYEHVPVPEGRIAPPVRRVDELPVAEVLISPSGATILDFGQNLVGRLRIRVDGPAGARLTLRHAEVLEDGELSLRPLRNAASTDVLELAGDGEVTWEPRFTFHGFRYAAIEGWPGDIDPAHVTAVVLASDLPRTGWFESSHELLDRLHENVVWGMRGNFLSIPTDCPQRDERLGWTGDIQVFAPTASFLADSDAFLTSWLRDLAHEQRRGHGVVPLVVPAALPSFGIGGPTAAWGDAATIVPWVLYERFGDEGVLRDAYPSMRDWVDALLAVADDAGLWSGAMQLGDWLDPDAPPDQPGKAKVDGDLVASAYLARSLRIVADAAEVLREIDDRERYAALAERTRAAFVAEYVTPAGRMMSDAPTAYALALRFDLVTDAAQRTRLAARLAELVRERGYRIATGFVGTPLVADALADAGHRYAAERLLLQTECPSWLYPVTMGATTVWERWDSLLPDGSVNPGEMTSFNHYALGAVADWLHRTVAGLAPDAPGYRRIRIAPRPLGALTRARAEHRTPYGPASVVWRRDGDAVVVTAEVPSNTEAVVDLPGTEPTVVGSGRHEWRFIDRADAASRRPLGLDSPSAAIIDDPEAYRVFLDTLAAHDPARAEAVRVDTVWAEGRPLRQALMFTPPEVLADVERALAALS